MIPYCRILIADDHSMIRMGLKMNLQFMLGYTNIEEAVTLSELEEKLSRSHYTHLILDIIFADGISLEAAPGIRKRYPDLQILIFSMQPPEVYAKSFGDIGIRYYMHKNCGEEEILSTLENFMNNETNPNFTRWQILQNPFSLMSLTELKVLHYYLNRCSVHEIAKRLSLSTDTAGNTLHDLHFKTATSNILELTNLAMLYKIGY